MNVAWVLDEGDDVYAVVTLRGGHCDGVETFGPGEVGLRAGSRDE